MSQSLPIQSKLLRITVWGRVVCTETGFLLEAPTRSYSLLCSTLNYRLPDITSHVSTLEFRPTINGDCSNSLSERRTRARTGSGYSHSGLCVILNVCTCYGYVQSHSVLFLYDFHVMVLQSDIFFRCKIFETVCCKGYSLTLQEFKRNEGRVQGT